MHQSLSTMAQLTLNTSFDCTKLQALRASLKGGAEKLGLANITLNDIVLYAVSRTVLNHKDANAHFYDDKMVFFKNVHLGLAVDSPRGLIVPTIFNANKKSLNDIPELQDALRRAYGEIEEEIDMGIENEDEYVLKCQGLLAMDPDELNDLVANRDPHALEFFGLEDADDDELDEWDANELDELPLIKDFVEEFEPYSPYDEGWDLNVRFVDPNE
jgi:hypothetical protein